MVQGNRSPRSQAGRIACHRSSVTMGRGRMRTAGGHHVDRTVFELFAHRVEACTQEGDLRLDLFTIAKGSQATVTLSVTAPPTIGASANTGTATSADVIDPQPANNS